MNIPAVLLQFIVSNIADFVALWNADKLEEKALIVNRIALAAARAKTDADLTDKHRANPGVIGP